MVRTGLDRIVESFPSKLKNRKIGVLCHAPSITRDYVHIVEVLAESENCTLSAIFGPQHGLFGQTQDNMIEWEGESHPLYGIPVYSLYGRHRKPTPEMLSGLEAFVVDVQDAGARLYTYIWTVKLCMEACAEAGIPVWILDRPNPVACLPFDGPILKPDFFTFVGGASIPLCHRMTTGEMALWIRKNYHPNCDLTVVEMDGWRRDSLYSETGLPWVLPSPNLPTVESALVYPGTVLIEALNLSEGRGTTKPFELFGAPWLDTAALLKEMKGRELPGCTFRQHDYIPTFHKYCGELCQGVQIHLTNPRTFRPVETAFHLFDSIIEISPPGSLTFNPPPYEYEERLTPFDILAGDDQMRLTLQRRLPLTAEIERWHIAIGEFREEFEKIALYQE
jgi:uncharacterized protein YbbC (DUF1343 family)